MTHTLSSLASAARASCASVLLCLVACSSPAGTRKPAADGVSVSPGSEVRQGQAGITLSIERASGGLSGPVQVDLAGLEVVVDPSSTDQRLVLAVTVPHGAITGGRTLGVVTSGGSIRQDDVIDVTPISVAPNGDDTNVGSTSAPYRTLRQALSVAGAKDTCVLSAGTYDAQSGETWQYAVPDQLTISGDSADNTQLVGPAAAALTPAGTLTLENISLSNFAAAIRVTQPAQLLLQAVALGGTGEGIVLAAPNSTVKLSGGTVASATYGIELAGACDQCSLDINGTTLTESGDGAIVQVSKLSQHSQLSFEHAVLNGGTFVADATATLSIQDSALTGNAANAALNFGGAQLDVTGSAFTAGTGPYGINLESGMMTLTGSSVAGNQYGVYQLGGSSKVRNTKITNYSSIGFYFASGDLDLGTETEAGNNSFNAASDGAFGMYVDTSTSPLTCSNTSFDGVVPATSVVQDSGTELLEQPHEYVLTPTKTISFYNVP